jgi:hypothetical protein
MKLNIAVLFYMATSTATNAFAPSIISRQSSSLSLVSLLMQDTSKAVEEAMAASEKYGKTSPEASAAWAIVEELDAANR